MGETRRGKYWEPNPDREQKAKEKRERRQLRNIKQVWSAAQSRL